MSTVEGGSNPTDPDSRAIAMLGQPPAQFHRGVNALYFIPDSNRPEGNKEPTIVPVYNPRDPSQYDLIALEYADPKKMGVAFGIGLFGAVFRVPSPRDERFPNARHAITRFKADRSPNDKLPIFMHPKNLADIMDLSKVHPDFKRFITTREARENMYRQAGAIHIIVPVKEDYPHLDSVFVHTKQVWEDKKAPLDQHLDVPTVSAFYWDDPDHEKIAFRAESIMPNGFMAISSFNKHGEEPAWNFQGLVDFIQNNNLCPFDYVVADPWNDELSVESSFAQIQIPLVGQEPVWRVYREGPTNIGQYLANIGSSHRFRIVEGAKMAARPTTSLGLDLEPGVWRVIENTRHLHEKRTSLETKKSLWKSSSSGQK